MEKLFVISGSSGVGKGTVISEFLARNPQFKLSVSCTTRAPREGEVDAQDYFFLTRDEFERAAAAGEFIEWAQFAGNLYGTRAQNLEKNTILEIDTQGALQLKEKIPTATLIFIEPPSIEELEIRLRGRGTEGEDAIARRLDFVKKELEIAKNFDYRIINDRIENAVAQLEAIIC